MNPNGEPQPDKTEPQEADSITTPALNSSEVPEEPDFSSFSPEHRHLGTGTYWSERDQARFDHAMSGVAPQILASLEAEGDLFGRWSSGIENDMKPGRVSRALFGNWWGRREPLEEKGISAHVLKRDDPNFGLNLRNSMAGARGYKPRQLYIVRGKPVGFGLDGEPVLDPTSIKTVLVVPYTSKVFEENPDIAAEHRREIAEEINRGRAK